MALFFLRIDAVLRRSFAPKDQLEPHLLESLLRFIAVMEERDPVEVVITNAGTAASALDEIRSTFPPSFRWRIVGSTPSFPARDGSRYEEILAYLEENDLERESWLAIDDDPLGFPPALETLILVNPDEGFQWTSLVDFPKSSVG